MCGIFGYIGDRDAPGLLIDGLRRLEYRGYDSAGIAVANGANLQIRKVVGKVHALGALLDADPPHGTRGIAHTRWATHGGLTEANAHPHLDDVGDIAVVHNGIVENYDELKRRLIGEGHSFHSETDTEVIPHLIESHVALGLDFPDAVRASVRELRGAHAIVCMSGSEPGLLVAARAGNAGGITVGFGRGEMFVASDLSAIAPHTASVAFLAPGEVAVVSPEGADFSDLEGNPSHVKRGTISTDALSVARGGYKHFMLKEIHEQPEGVINALSGRTSFSPAAVTLDETSLTRDDISGLRRVVLLGMGTSLYAAQLGALYIEELARIPATAEDASEFRYRNPVLDRDTLVVAVGQSGETADTLEAMHHVRHAGARLLTVVNVEGSQATQVAEGTLLTHSGPEISVASSKTFTNSLVCLLLLAIHLGAERGALVPEDVGGLVHDLAHLPALLGSALEANGDYAALAYRYERMRRWLFVGRGLLRPIANEGAMKLKETSYVHAEGMTAAMLKHGPIALVDPETAVVAMAPAGGMREKTLGNINEVLAREGPVLAVATEGDEEVARLVSDVLWIPQSPPLLEPIVCTLPLQLLAYHIAEAKGADVDQPRNLAKTVTVE